jgi:DNA-binding FrmR family transcriptional regulator
LARSAQTLRAASTGASSTSREKEKLLHRARRIGGQADAIERAILADRTCLDLVNLIVATRGALNALMAEVVREHVFDHVLEPTQRVTGPRGRAAQELLSILKSYI